MPDQWVLTHRQMELIMMILNVCSADTGRTIVAAFIEAQTKGCIWPDMPVPPTSSLISELFATVTHA